MKTNATSSLVRRRTAGAAVAAAAVLAAWGAAGPPSAGAKEEEPVSPVHRYLTSVDVGAAFEHRLVVVHPLTTWAGGARAAADVRLPYGADAERVALGSVGPGARIDVEALAFDDPPLLFLAGDVLSTQHADYAVTRTTAATKGRRVDVPAARVSRDAEPDPSHRESAALGPVLPSPLRFLVLSGAEPRELSEACRAWADDAKLATPRRSPAEPPTAEPLAKRFADYRRVLTAAFRTPAAPGREVVGCAVLVDGAPAFVETWADGRLFATAWPRLADAIASEATVAEARAELLEEPMADPADPDRFLADVKERLLAVFAVKPAPQPVKDAGAAGVIRLDGAVAEAYLPSPERVAHFVLIVDPARRHEPRTGEGPDPNVASRKARPTEEEKRLLERRKTGTPVPDPPPPPIPAPPK